MFPKNYSFNPGVVLDPVTMTPMITNSGNITVNPLGVPMRPEQKVWQKMFIKNIPQECPNQIMIRLLNEFGAVKNFKRAADNRGRLLTFCHFDLETGEEILRIQRLFQNIKILDRTLEIKISAETQNFIKEWMTMQKEEWRKKLLAPSLNEAKEYDTIEIYQMRDDKKYKQRIEETLRVISQEVKKIVIEKMKEEERKEHPKQKERERNKKKMQEEMQRNFHQKEEYWLKRERDKERQYRKEKEKDREREKAKVKRLEKEMNLDEEELEKRNSKFLLPERRRFLQKQAEEDFEILLEENPPLPEEAMEPNKKIRAIAEEQIQLGAETVEEVLVEAPKRFTETTEKTRELKKNQIFDGWEQQYEVVTEKEVVELNLPELEEQIVDKEEQARIKDKLKQLEEQVPKNKQGLWQFPINWDKLSKSVVLEKNIRPWLEKRSDQYIGGVQEKFIALVEKKLLSRSHPDKIIKILKSLLDDDAQEFVLRLWKTLVLEYLKLQAGLV